MNKYIVWTSLRTGEYVKADKVEEFEGKVIFIRTDGVVDIAIKEFLKKDILEYHEVK